MSMLDQPENTRITSPLLQDITTAKDFIAGLAGKGAPTTLPPISAALASTRAVTDLPPDTRLAIVCLLDEAAAALLPALLDSYLAAEGAQNVGAPDLFRDAIKLRQDGGSQTVRIARQEPTTPYQLDCISELWQALADFSQQAATAYSFCLGECLSAAHRDANKPVQGLSSEKLAWVAARATRLMGLQLKLHLMRYLPIEAAFWQDFFHLYRFALAHQITATLVSPYAPQTRKTSVQLEFLRALLLEVASPDALTPMQIELAYRMTGRFAPAFDFLDQPGERCGYYINLGEPAEPGYLDREAAFASANLRFFGGGAALEKMEQIVKQNELGTIDHEMRFGDEYTADEKLAVLKHLQIFWAANPPRRRQERKGVNVDIDVCHDFSTIKNQVAQIESEATFNLTPEIAAWLRDQAHAGTDDAAADFAPEAWTAQDVSGKGVGATIPPQMGYWVKIGRLCGIKSQSSETWWVGVVRRLRTDAQHVRHIGIALLARKPVAAWLRAPRTRLASPAMPVDKPLAPATEPRDVSSDYDYLHVILLPDEHQAFAQATALAPRQSFKPEQVFEILMGDKRRSLKFVDLLERGADFDHIRIQWLSMV